MSSSKVFAALSALGLTWSGAVAVAEEQHWTATSEGYAKHLSDAGTWQFAATKRNAEGKPECIETWTFDTDGSGMLVSGEQEIALSWRYVKDDILGMVLRINYERSSPGRDCLGREVDPGRYPRDNGPGFELLFRNGGNSALVCNAPQVMVDENGDVRKFEDGQPMTLQSLENCWGELEPMATARSQG